MAASDSLTLKHSYFKGFSSKVMVKNGFLQNGGCNGFTYISHSKHSRCF